jgi:hypothetical protein
MDLNLNGFIPGRASQFAFTREYELDRIVVPSGRLLIRDPFGPREAGCAMLVEPASYRVWATAVDAAANEPDSPQWYVPAYLSIQLSMAPTVRLDYADDLMEPPVPSIGAWTGTDHGIIAIHDGNVLPDSDIPALVEEWDRTLNSNEPYPFGCGNVPLPETGGCNIVFSRSGWGDGGFPILATFDAFGSPNAIHVDFRVVDTKPPRPGGRSKGIAPAVRRMLRRRSKRPQLAKQHRQR